MILTYLGLVEIVKGFSYHEERAMTEPTLVRNILFATDFSGASRLAGESAAVVARHFGARLHVLHVVPPVTDPTPAPGALRAVAAELQTGPHGRDGDRVGSRGATHRRVCPA
jgi:nucleotide-binding universal stress UspA family protein